MVNPLPRNQAQSLQLESMGPKIMTRFAISALAATTLFLGACASPEVVQPKKISDGDLSCTDLKEQIVEAERFEKEARDDRGVTGTNVAAALLFWPALIVTYANTEDAIEAAEERRAHLLELYEAKNCS